jgi:hypothetical protein
LGRVTQRLRDMALESLAVLESRGIDKLIARGARPAAKDGNNGDGSDKATRTRPAFRQDENLLLVSKRRVDTGGWLLM